MFGKFVVFATAIATVFATSSPDGNIVRPCLLDDLKCIGDNLAANSACDQKVQGAIPCEYTLYDFKYETPFFNSSFIENTCVVRNHHNCRVSEFFFNKKADSAVLALDCPLLDLEANRTLIQHTSLQEDKDYSYTIRGVYPLIRLTTHIRGANAIDLCSSFTFADVTALPNFVVTPNNQPTANFLSRDLTALNVYEREMFFYKAGPLFRYFVNSLICNFGCNF